jgi:crossover junction endodeoxyribonuclease RuvC
VRVLGLDPGSRHTGWGVVDCFGASATAVAWGRISPPAAGELGARWAAISAGVERALIELSPELVAMERVFHGANTRSLIVLAQARGALVAAVAKSGVPLVELAPAAVKSAVTGNGRADKEQVMRMVKLSLGLLAQELSRDASDALAIALVAAQGAFARVARRP